MMVFINYIVRIIGFVIALAIGLIGIVIFIPGMALYYFSSWSMGISSDIFDWVQRDTE